jgi:sulfatase maturation enzyme AslB (radical SAM superfamily)
MANIAVYFGQKPRRNLLSIITNPKPPGMVYPPDGPSYILEEDTEMTTYISAGEINMMPTNRKAAFECACDNGEIAYCRRCERYFITTGGTTCEDCIERVNERDERMYHAAREEYES